MVDPDAGVRLLIAERTPLAAHLLTTDLGKHRQIEVVGGLFDSRELTKTVGIVKPDVALISADLDNNPHRGFEVTRELHDCHRTVKVVMLLESSERNEVLEALRAGARGIFSRSGSPQLLRRCIFRVAAGHIWVDTEHMEFVLDALAGMTSFKVVDTNGRALLSAREQQVLACVAEGLTNRDIASRLELSEHTVKNHLFHIFDKLGVSNRVELVMYAVSQLTPARDPDAKNSVDTTEEVISVEWCWKAAEQGFSLAQYLRAATHLQGRVKDQVAALRWLLTAQATAARIEKAARSAALQLRPQMTLRKISQAQRQSAEWLEKHSGPPELFGSGDERRREEQPKRGAGRAQLSDRDGASRAS